MWWKVAFRWQLMTTSSVTGLRSSKALPRAKLTPKNSHGHCLVVCCQSDPLQLPESQETIIYEKHAQQFDEMHGKLQRLKPASVNRMGPIRLHDTAWSHIAQPNTSKVEQIGPRNFSLICHIHLTSQQLITTSSILKIFVQESASTTNRMQKMPSKSLLNPKAQIFTLQE